MMRVVRCEASTRDGPGAAVAEVLVRFAGRMWALTPGSEVTFGRGADRDIRFGHDPLDDHVSRAAGTLRAGEDEVLVRNDSATRPVLVQVPGLGREIEPGEAMVLPRQRDFAVVVVGGFDARYELRVHTGQVAAQVNVHNPASRGADTPPTVSAGPVRLTVAQHRLLVALCEPLLRPAGPDAAPATYRQIGERLDRAPGHVRNVLKQLRESLAGAGVPGLLAEGGRDDAAYDFRRPLAMWALRTGAVRAEDLGSTDG